MAGLGQTLQGVTSTLAPATGPGTDANAQKEKIDKELAQRLSSLIEEANSRVTPLVRMIRKNIDSFEAQKPEDRDEDTLVKNVRPLLEQSQKYLDETNGAVRGADPDNRLTKEATRNAEAHNASPEEQRLADALKTMLQEVGGTVDWAKDKLNNFPKAKKDLGPLLDALSQPLTQIVGGVGMLLTGVLSLVKSLLRPLGLDGLLTGIISATGLDKICDSLGLKFSGK